MKQNAPSRKVPSGIDSRNRILDWIEDAHTRLQAKNCENHAQLVMAGIAGNINVRRILALLVTMETAESPVISLKRAMFLANVHPKFFTKVYGCFRACGALLPDLSLYEDEAQTEVLVATIEGSFSLVEQHPDPVSKVEELWRRQTGDVVNPAVSSLIKVQEY